MAIQKDMNNNTNKNKALEATGNSANVSNYYNVVDQDMYVALAERSSKLVTALYMVSDFLDANDAMRNLLRSSSAEAMRELFSLTHAHKINRVETLSKVHTMLFAVLSYIDILFRNGFVSEMNTTIIKQEIEKLRADIDMQIKKSLPYDRKENNTLSVREFSFSDSFFAANSDAQGQKRAAAIAQAQPQPQPQNIKDTSKENPADIKDTDDETPIFVPRPSPKKAFEDAYEKKRQAMKPSRKKVIREPKVNEAKQERKENILKILKQKRDASINDISILFKDISAKTIQRDLSELIEEGLIIKEGSRRWSKYNLSY